MCNCRADQGCKECCGDNTPRVNVDEASMTLEEYLRKSAIVDEVVDFSVRVFKDGENGIEFYIHPANKSGMTVNFLVSGNNLTTVCVDK